MGIKFTGIAGGKGDGCCGCTVTIRVTRCGGDLASATVTIKNTGGGSTVATGTTSSLGLVTLTIPGAATYTVQVAKTGIATVSQDLALACTGPIVLFEIGPSAPGPLTLTDANTTIVLPNTSGGATPQWGGGYFFSRSNTAVVSVGPHCIASGPAGSGDMGICYNVTCNADGTVTVQRAWTIVGDAFFVRHYSRKGAGQTDPCSPIGCLGQDSSKTSAPSSFSPFAWSDSLTPGAGNLLADPVGGTVALS